MSGSMKENARAGDQRQSLADQLGRFKSGGLVPSGEGSPDGTKRGFVKLAEDLIPGVKQRIKAPELITETPRDLSPKTVEFGLRASDYREAATPEDAIAREAVARVEERDGFTNMCQQRRHGCHDGDDYHKAALEAVRLTMERMNGQLRIERNG